MALLFPRNLPLDVRVDRRRTAERILYNAAKKLNDSFFVFYSCDWRRSFSWSRRQGGCDLGECDFVFMSAIYGILCIEVKGGAISHCESGFYSTDKQGRVHAIKDPYSQALRSKFYFLDFFRSIRLKEFLGACGDSYIRHAVFFPESLDSGWMKDDLCFSREISGFALDTNALSKWLDNVYGGPLSKRGLEDLSSCTIEKICDVISPVSDCKFALSSIIGETEDYFRQNIVPTTEQWYLIDQLRFRKKELIIGGAGTGKTLLVIEYLKRYAGSEHNNLFLCSSSFLAHELRMRYQEIQDPFRIRSLSEFTDDILALFDEFQISHRGSSFIDMIDIIATRSIFRYDILVIDEMQDIEQPLLASLSRLVNAGGQFICCYDPEQKPFDSDSPLRTAEEMGFASVYTLTYNIRNTPEIMNYFLCHCPNKTVWRSLAPSGVPVRELIVAKKSTSSIVEVVHSVLEEADVSPGKVAILFKDYAKLISAKAVINNAILNGDVSEGWGALRISTAIDFKGLESNVVLVWEPESLGETELYVACSRARSSLYLAHYTTPDRQITAVATRSN